MSKIVEYISINADEHHILNKLANELIKEGWVPYGGVSCTVSMCLDDGCICTKYRCSQAFVKYDVIPF